MSIGETGICVRILEKEFRVSCPKDQAQALRDAALYLDKQMRVIRQTGRVIGIERIAVMAALNITNELLTLKNTVPEVETAFSERLKILQDKIDGVLAQGAFRLLQEQTTADQINAKDGMEQNETSKLELAESE